MEHESSHQHPDELLLLLPLAPSVNEAYRTVLLLRRSGNLYSRRVSTHQLSHFKQVTLSALRTLLQGISWRHAHALGYQACIFVPTARSDLSNRLKALEDVICEALGGVNDNKIYEFSVRKFVDAAFPRILMRVYQLSSKPVPFSFNAGELIDAFSILNDSSGSS